MISILKNLVSEPILFRDSSEFRDTYRVHYSTSRVLAAVAYVHISCNVENIFFSLSASGLQNDHKDLMKQIEQGLYEVHAQIRDQKKDEPVAMETASSAKVTRSAFARVDKVDGGSPASVAVSLSFTS